MGKEGMLMSDIGQRASQWLAKEFGIEKEEFEQAVCNLAACEKIEISFWEPEED